MSEAIKHVRDFDLDRRARAKVISSERITPTEIDVEVREITMDVDNPDFEVEVGQSIAVIAPGSSDIGHEEHIRLYSIADLPERGPGGPRLRICVRRVSYVDEYSGEEYPGLASNYLCDLGEGDALTIAGPFGGAFMLPPRNDANLILIGTGTGIAPFRAFVKKLFSDRSGFIGKVYLFYGATSGLEMVYMNDEQDDFAQYYDVETFEAFRAVSPRPHWADPIAWDFAIGERGDEILYLLDDPKTYVFVAGLEKIRPELDKIFAGLVGSEADWETQKAELIKTRRWVELLY